MKKKPTTKHAQNIYVAILSGNSLGLENDSVVFQSALRKAFPNVRSNLLLGKESSFQKALTLFKLFAQRLRGKTLVFIHMEEVQSKLVWAASQNYLIPNQDWFRSHTEKTTLANKRIVLLCKTKDALRAFSDMEERAHYLGFSSLDRLHYKGGKDFNRYLHLAGKSEKKGTLSVIEAWKRHPEWPTLTLQTTVDDHIQAARNIANIHLITQNQTGEDLLTLMNSHGVHLCVSEMEGFGHYIVEALSTGAVVLTTDGAPMNELVTPSCGFLVSCRNGENQYRAKGFKIDQTDLENTIQKLTKMPLEDFLTMSENSRHRYLELTSQFETNVKHYFDESFS